MGPKNMKEGKAGKKHCVTQCSPKVGKWADDRTGASSRACFSSPGEGTTQERRLFPEGNDAASRESALQAPMQQGSVSPHFPQGTVEKPGSESDWPWGEGSFNASGSSIRGGDLLCWFPVSLFRLLLEMVEFGATQLKRLKTERKTDWADNDGTSVITTT